MAPTLGLSIGRSVSFLSSATNRWVRTEIINVDPTKGFQIDRRPKSWLTLADLGDAVRLETDGNILGNSLATVL